MDNIDKNKSDWQLMGQGKPTEKIRTPNMTGRWRIRLKGLEEENKENKENNMRYKDFYTDLKEDIQEKKEIIGTCVENPFKSIEKLKDIIDNAIEITKSDFLKHCSIDDELTFTHSAIEHFFM